jgi:hypothetical protein
MSEREPDAEPRPEPRTLADHLREYVRDSTLWPVLLVAAAIFVTLGAAVLVSAIGDRNPFALAALLLLLGVSLDASVRELRSTGFGTICGMLLAFWGLSAAAAGAVLAFGWG